MLTLRARHIKWVLGPAVLFFIMIAAVPITHGGILWSGIDPIFSVDDHQFNVRVEYPSQYDCSLLRDIQVFVKVPWQSQRTLITESQGTLGGCSQTTRTYFYPSLLRDEVEVRVVVIATEDFLVKVKVDRDGKWVAQAFGESNDLIRVSDIELDDDDHLGADPALAGLPANIMQYTYME
ncbi:MAG: hypothetical protein L0177_01690 [Chloroflexi bacterium]|nr:hypothetical protein [Chloroflexota bacterium]